MYVSKPRVLSSFLPFQQNARHPDPWPLGDPQKVIHIDTILILRLQTCMYGCLSTRLTLSMYVRLTSPRSQYMSYEVRVDNLFEFGSAFTHEPKDTLV